MDTIKNIVAGGIFLSAIAFLIAGIARGCGVGA